jgi:hypothetical protein
MSTHWQIFCVTENKSEDWTLEPTDPIPTTCPNNTTHTIDPSKTKQISIESPQLVQQVLGSEALNVYPKKLIFTAPKGVDTAFYLLLDKAFSIRGGILHALSPTFGDWLEIYVVDKDNILGMGAGTILKKYIPEWGVFPGLNELIDISISILPCPGLYFQLIYHSVSTATDDSKCILNLYSYVTDTQL